MYTRKEQEENRQKWVEALRSGDYKQGQKRLRIMDDNTFCCLGVACDISELNKWNVFGYGQQLFSYGQQLFGHGITMLPSEVSNWLGLTSHEGELFFIDEEGVLTMTYLTNLNDSDYTFEQIADIIEMGYLELV